MKIRLKIRFLVTSILGLALSVTAGAQDGSSTPSAGQDSSMGAGGGYGQRGGGMRMLNSRSVTGTVTEAATDHYTVKTFTGDTYVVNFSANTRMFKQVAGMRGQNGGMGGNRPEEIQPTDIKAGDAIAAVGTIDTTAKSVGALRIVQLDPEVARRMQQAEAGFGKTWLMGKVTAIDGVTVTLTGPEDAAYIFVADENTDFRKRREPIALTDVQVGDRVRVDGAVKNGVFTAAVVNVMDAMQVELPRGPRNTPPQNSPQPPDQ
jgi:hypothetical protein